MNYCGLHTCDIANGEGVRVSLFVSGCRNHCPGCFQPETWKFEYGQKFTTQTLGELVEALDHSWIAGLTLLGGDPCEPENAETVCIICATVKELLPGKTIWLYTGYKYEDVSEKYPWIEKLVDVVVDGPFVEEKKILGEYRGSSNQRIIRINDKKENNYD